jgi:hypothetical protein
VVVEETASDETCLQQHRRSFGSRPVRVLTSGNQLRWQSGAPGHAGGSEAQTSQPLPDDAEHHTVCA